MNGVDLVDLRDGEGLAPDEIGEPVRDLVDGISLEARSQVPILPLGSLRIFQSHSRVAIAPHWQQALMRCWPQAIMRSPLTMGGEHLISL